MGFGPDFCRRIATLYNGAYMRIILNNWLTERISPERGVRQGDPWSPLLYVLCIEVLADLIRGSPKIKGFLLTGSGGLQAKVRLYVNDTTLLLKDSRSLSSLFELIDLFEKRTGAKLNRSKTDAMWLGAWKFCNGEPHGLTWVRKMKILGVVFGVVDTKQDNWQPN